MDTVIAMKQIEVGASRQTVASRRCKSFDGLLFLSRTY